MKYNQKYNIYKTEPNYVNVLDPSAHYDEVIDSRGLHNQDIGMLTFGQHQNIHSIFLCQFFSSLFNLVARVFPTVY